MSAKTAKKSIEEVNMTRGQKAAQTRRGEVTRKDITTIVSQIREIAAALDGEVTAMEAAKIRSMTVDGVTKAERGIEQLRQFIAKISAAIAKAKWSN